MDNTQFIYELQLATLETEALVKGATLRDDLRHFQLPAAADISTLLSRSAYIASVDGALSDYARLTTHNVTRSFNQYVTHWFYPYKGKFHPQMVRALINIIGMKADEVLLDPFMGSGTTAVEGALAGMKTVGFDVSPLCALIASVKANAVHHLASLQQSEPLIRRKIKMDKRVLSQPIKSFELLAQLISLSDEVRRRRNFETQLVKNRAKMLQSVEMMQRGCDDVGLSPPPAQVQMGDARCLPLANDSVDGIVTSPPYSIALNYVANDKHALQYLGSEPEKSVEQFIGVRGTGGAKAKLYEQDMKEAYAEMARVLRPGKKVAIVLGDATVNGVRLPTVADCESTFVEIGFRRLHNVNKTIFGLYNVMQRENILIFQKP